MIPCWLSAGFFYHDTVTPLRPAYPQKWLKSVWAPRGKGRVWWLRRGAIVEHTPAFNLDVSFIAHVEFCPWSMTFQCTSTYDVAGSHCSYSTFVSFPHFDPADLASIQFPCHYDSAAAHCVDFFFLMKTFIVPLILFNSCMQTLHFRFEMNDALFYFI